MFTLQKLSYALIHCPVATLRGGIRYLGATNLIKSLRRGVYRLLSIGVARCNATFVILTFVVKICTIVMFQYELNNRKQALCKLTMSNRMTKTFFQYPGRAQCARGCLRPPSHVAYSTIPSIVEHNLDYMTDESYDLSIHETIH